MGVMVAPYWDNLTTASPGEGIYALTSAAHRGREFVLEWRATKVVGELDPPDPVQFSLVFREWSPTIYVHYFRHVSAGASATIGVQRPEAGLHRQQSCNAPAVGGSENLIFSIASPVADIDGDGSTDLGVFRPSSGTWFVQGGPVVQFGTAGDIPVPGHYDGDPSDIAVFRASSGFWFVKHGPVTAFGTTGDVPLSQPRGA